jgi:hypothetical protein
VKLTEQDLDVTLAQMPAPFFPRPRVQPAVFGPYRVPLWRRVWRLWRELFA